MKIASAWEEELLIDIHNIDLGDRCPRMEGVILELKDFDTGALDQLSKNLNKIKSEAVKTKRRLV